jgi:hypothetical protein
MIGIWRMDFNVVDKKSGVVDVRIKEDRTCDFYSHDNDHTFLNQGEEDLCKWKLVVSKGKGGIEDRRLTLIFKDDFVPNNNMLAEMIKNADMKTKLTKQKPCVVGGEGNCEKCQDGFCKECLQSFDLVAG